MKDLEKGSPLHLQGAGGGGWFARAWDVKRRVCGICTMGVGRITNIIPLGSLYHDTIITPKTLIILMSSRYYIRFRSFTALPTAGFARNPKHLFTRSEKGGGRACFFDGAVGGDLECLQCVV